MRNAFIVYTSSDRRLAVRLWDELHWHGLDVGIDLQDAPPHLERSAVLEDIVFQLDLLLVIVGKRLTDELRRLHMLAIEQEQTIIVLQLPGGELPGVLQTRQTVMFGNFTRGLEHLLRLIPADMLNKTPDENQILTNLRHTSSDVRRTNLFLVGRDRIHAGLTTAVCYMLSDVDPQVRAVAAWALDQLGNVDAASALIYALHDPSYDVRSNAGWALVNIGRRRDSPASRVVTQEVITVLRDSENQDAREIAYQVLLRLGGREAFDAISRYWNQS